MNPDRRQIKELGEMAEQVGMVLVGDCSSCDFYDAEAAWCDLRDRSEDPDFGCVMWQAKKKVDSWMSMTDEELRVKAGRLLGRDIAAEDAERDETNAAFGGVATVGKRWDPVEDIAAAWELHTSKISYRGCCGTDFRDRNKYLKALEVAMREEQDVFMSWPYVMALLTPRAITRAFILAMEPDDA